MPAAIVCVIERGIYIKKKVWSGGIGLEIYDYYIPGTVVEETSADQVFSRFYIHSCKVSGSRESDTVIAVGVSTRRLRAFVLFAGLVASDKDLICGRRLAADITQRSPAHTHNSFRVYLHWARYLYYFFSF